MRSTGILAFAFTVLLACQQAYAADIDVAILNFALNLECLEAEFYSFAAFGKGLNKTQRGGGPVPTGGRKAHLSSAYQKLAKGIAEDEIAHVEFLRAALGAAAVPCPKINLRGAFHAAANAALGTTLKPPFAPYDNDILFLHGAFIFEDVGVTAYKGAAALITNPAYLTAAAGIMAVEAYHAGAVRTKLLEHENLVVKPYGATVLEITHAISALRAKVGGKGKDAGITDLAPTDKNAVAFSRTPEEVLAIVYLGKATKPGGFFPRGLNGSIK